MKKRNTAPPKQKEFANTAFSALKGVQAKPADPLPVTPQEQPVVKGREPDDMSLFLEAMSGVDRLGTDRLGADSGRQRHERAANHVKAIVRRRETQDQNLFLEAINSLKLDVTFHEERPDEPLPGKPSSVSRLKQLRRGTIRIDYELDLHGLSKDEALDALASFLKGAYRREQKAVLVITGRGNHSPEEPVLKEAVDSWLREDGKDMVVEILTAPRQLGGDGALVVFLRQAKETPLADD